MSTHSRHGAANYLDHLLRSGMDRQQLVPYVDRVEKLQSECGCAMSGAFASVALLVAIAAGVARYSTVESPVRSVCLALLAVFVAGLLGKGIGISIARIRLWLLYREMKHVYMHQVG